ncbi:hypothetical protein JCM25156A_11850 [Komagataeibacter kakiaceti JCM 25156]
MSDNREVLSAKGKSGTVSIAYPSIMPRVAGVVSVLAGPIRKTGGQACRARWPPPVRPPGKRPVPYYFSRSGETLPPFCASFCITCACSQMFMDAESFVSPV